MPRRDLARGRWCVIFAGRVGCAGLGGRLSTFALARSSRALARHYLNGPLLEPTESRSPCFAEITIVCARFGSGLVVSARVYP